MTSPRKYRKKPVEGNEVVWLAHGFIRNGQWEPAGDGGWFPEQTGESN